MAEIKKETAVAKPTATVKELIEGAAFKQQIAKALPKHLKPDRFVRIALTALMRTPKLAQCDQASLFNCLLTLSQLGIEPDGRRAHLIPFENRKRGITECQLIIDYKGLVELAMRSGMVANIHADVVCENDVFKYDRGAITAHEIDFRKERGAVYAVYAICKFKDGTEKTEVMSRIDCLKIRDNSPAWKFAQEKATTVWGSYENEMLKKTVFRRLSKWLTLSPEYRDAVEIDDKTDSIDVSFTERTPVSMPKELPEQTEQQPDRQAQTPAAQPPRGSNADTAEPSTIEKISIFWQESGLSEGKLISLLRKDGLLGQMDGLEKLEPNKSAEVLAGIGVYASRASKVK